jgi:thiamine-phosphate pyrophosphorylase
VRRRVDWSLHLVTDRKLAGPRSVEDLVRAAVRGGVTVVQLREKDMCAREFIDLARRLKIFLADTGVPLIVNDRVDVALAARADGVHLGQSDMDPRDARRLLGPDAIIGLSVETTEQAERAAAFDVDYLGAGPIFWTPTKPELTGAWGTEGLAGLRALSRHKLVAIGGISAANAAEVMRAGADGVAVVSAICAAPDPEGAARELLRIVKKARE